MPMRVLIADDEPLAREALHDALTALGDIIVVALCGDGATASAEIARFRPDAAFLDIAMPEVSGLDVARALDPNSAPAVVFVTAYDAHAVEAFELAAADYILKPFSPARIAEAVNRVQQRLASRAPRVDARLFEALDALQAMRTRGPSRLLGSIGNRIAVIDLEDVEHFESEGNYVRANAADRAVLVRETLSALDARLDPASFVRVHRSHVVAIRAIRELRPLPSGDYEVLLASGAVVPMSRTHRDAVLRVLRRA